MTLKKAYLIILMSFIWLIVGSVGFDLVDAPKGSRLEDLIGWTLLIGFGLIFLSGTAVWAGAKGYARIIGVLLGWLGPLGLLVLVFLPDRTIETGSRDVHT